MRFYYVIFAYLSSSELLETLNGKDLELSTACMQNKNPCVIESLDCTFKLYVTSKKFMNSIKQLLSMIDASSNSGTPKIIQGIQSASLMGKALSSSAVAGIPDFARYNAVQNSNHNGWTAGYSNTNTYLQFGSSIPFKFHKIRLSGRKGFFQFIKSFKIRYSLDGINWTDYNNGQILIANENQFDPTDQVLNPFIARAARIYAQSWNDSIGCSLEWFISDIPIRKVLAEGSLIAAVASGFKVTASSAWDQSNGVQSISYDIERSYSNLGWCCGIRDTNQWIMVTSVVPVLWKRIGTKGLNNGNPSRVTSYCVNYTVDGNDWVLYKNGLEFSGNYDLNTEVLYILEPFVALAIRIHPLTWNLLSCMRLEVWCSEL